MNTKFASLEQRMIHTYLDTFPCFVPSESGPGIEAQHQFYQFMHGLYHRLSEEPVYLFRTLHEDDVYTQRFNKSLENKPKLKDIMRKAVKEVDALLMTLYEIARCGQVVGHQLVVDGAVKVSQKHQALLEQVGLRSSLAADHSVWNHAEYPDLFAGMTWMAKKPNASPLSFSRCLFREGYSYSSEIYARLSGNAEAFRKLESYLIEHGYARLDNWDGTTALDYLNTRGEALPTKGGFQYGIQYTGISASYDQLVDPPQIIGLCIPRMKEILTAFQTLPPSVQEFVMKRTKKCDNCHYCVQTDKTGKRPLAAQIVSYQGREISLCPYFPGYNYCEPYLSDKHVDDMIGMLDAIDRLFQKDKAVQA